MRSERIDLRSRRILVDTSVWIDHFTGRETAVESQRGSRVLLHEPVYAELVLGSLPDRKRTMRMLRELPSISSVSAEECVAFIEAHTLWAVGVGYVDVQLLQAALRIGVPLVTRDRRLCEAAKRLRIEVISDDGAA